MQPDTEPWEVCDRFLELRSRWMTLIGEHLRDNQGHLLEYWRIEKADSVIVLPIQGEVPLPGEASVPSESRFLLMPQASYRPGVGASTLDFPGGRVAPDQSPAAGAIAALERELGLSPAAITQLLPLNPQGWAVNSSFSNQRLYGFVAYLDATLPPPRDRLAATYPTTPAALQSLLTDLICLQCRAVLLEWFLR